MADSLTDFFRGRSFRGEANERAGRADFGRMLNDSFGGGADFGAALGMARLASGAMGDGAQQTQEALDATRRALGGEGFRLRDEEDARRRQALELLRGGLGDFDKSFADREKGLQGLQFSFAADQAGGKARSGLRDLRGMLGARGLGSSSGAASGLASRIALQQQGSLIGAKRDIALAAAQRSALHSAQRQQLIGGIAGLTNQGPSMIGLDTITNLHDSFSAQFANEAERKEASKTRKEMRRGAALGALGGIAGAAF